MYRSRASRARKRKRLENYHGQGATERPREAKDAKSERNGSETGSVLFYESRIHVHDVSSSNKVASRHYCILFGVELDADRSPRCPCCSRLSRPSRPQLPLVQAQRAPPANAGSAVVPRPSSQPCSKVGCCGLASNGLISPSAGAANHTQPRRTGSRALTTALPGPHASRWVVQNTYRAEKSSRTNLVIRVSYLT